MPRPTIVAVVLLSVGLTAGAQCPDGAPPPCRARPAAAAPARRADPPLDDRTWIVLPFDNLAKSPDVDWLRDASVNLLYLDLSKWVDIKVVDDERVADLLREVPEAQGGKTLSLAAGLAVAKRAGAGKLVMGDVLRIGSRTTVTAKVFDVRGGQRIRTTNQDAPVQDSLMPAFGRLARGILNVAPPEGTNVGAIGTTNTVAYQDYLEGVKALNRFDLKTARSHLEAALKQDSTFALAHYKLAVLIGWESAVDPAKVDHAKAAARFSGALPTREKTLVGALLAFNNQEFGRACVLYGSLVHADSTDVDALYGMGECLFHDNVVETIGGDTTRVRYRGSWNSAIRVFHRALAVDPTFHLAFQHILDSYTADGRSGCRLKDTTALRVANGNASCAEIYSTSIRRDGDSLLMVPVPYRNVSVLAAHAEEARRNNARYVNIQKARDVAKEWVDAGPSEPRALATLSRIDLMLGNVESADEALSKVRWSDFDDAELGRAFLTRIEIDWKRDRGTAFVHAIDSLAASHPTGQAANYAALGLASIGRLTMLDSIIQAQIRRSSTSAPPVVSQYLRLAPLVTLGASPDSAATAELTMFKLMAAAPAAGGGGTRNATIQTSSTTMFGLRLTRAEWPPIDSLPDPRYSAARAMARKDTAAVRTAGRLLDSIAKASSDKVPDNGEAIIAADAYLSLGDSNAALATIRQFLESGIRPTPIFTPLGGGFVFTSLLWPRALLLRGDLEVARGDKAAARKAYRTFLSLWTKVDPEFQPIVDRARKSLAALGPG